MKILELRALLNIVRSNLNEQTYRELAQDFDRLADDIRNEETAKYFEEHPQEMSNG
jgi:hypothetical protein